MTSPLPCDSRQGTHYFRRSECGGFSYSGAKADQGVTLVISWDRKGQEPLQYAETGKADA